MFKGKGNTGSAGLAIAVALISILPSQFLEKTKSHTGSFQLVTTAAGWGLPLLSRIHFANMFETLLNPPARHSTGAHVCLDQRTLCEHTLAAIITRVAGLLAGRFRV